MKFSFMKRIATPRTGWAVLTEDQCTQHAPLDTVLNYTKKMPLNLGTCSLLGSQDIEQIEEKLMEFSYFGTCLPDELGKKSSQLIILSSNLMLKIN